MQSTNGEIQILGLCELREGELELRHTKENELLL